MSQTYHYLRTRDTMRAASLAIYPSLVGLYYTPTCIKKARPKEALFTFYVFALCSASRNKHPRRL